MHFLRGKGQIWDGGHCAFIAREIKLSKAIIHPWEIGQFKSFKLNVIRFSFYFQLKWFQTISDYFT